MGRLLLEPIEPIPDILSIDILLARSALDFKFPPNVFVENGRYILIFGAEIGLS